MSTNDFLSRMTSAMKDLAEIQAILANPPPGCEGEPPESRVVKTLSGLPLSRRGSIRASMAFLVDAVDRPQAWPPDRAPLGHAEAGAVRSAANAIMATLDAVAVAEPVSDLADDVEATLRFMNLVIEQSRRVAELHPDDLLAQQSAWLAVIEHHSPDERDSIRRVAQLIVDVADGRRAVTGPPLWDASNPKAGGLLELMRFLAALPPSVATRHH